MKFSEVIDELVQRLAMANGDQSTALEPVADALEAGDAGPDTEPLLPVLDTPDAAIIPRSLERATAAAESMNLGLHLGAAVMRIADAANKGTEGAAELREAVWLIERYIELLDVRPLGADINAEQRRMARIEETLERLRTMSAAMSAQPAEVEPAPEQAEPSSATPVVAVEPAPPPASEQPSLGREIAFMAARWAVIVASVIVVVLAVTLIADLR